MFLIRTAFWLTLIILLLPANEQEQRQVYGTAGAAVRDLKTFCSRNPDVCQKSTTMFDTFSQKAQFGAKLVMDFVKEAASDDTTVASDADTPKQRRSLFGRRSQDADSRDTLTASDMEPAWQDPRSEPGI